jgi:hypothetical protein
VPYISGTLMKIPKQTPPNRDQLLISYLKRHSSVSRPPEKTSGFCTRRIKTGKRWATQ